VLSTTAQVQNTIARAPSTKAPRALNRNARELKPTALPLRVQAGPPAPNRTELAARAAQKSLDVSLARLHSRSPTEPVVKRSAAEVSKDGWPQECLRRPDSIRFAPRR
jgi:hypothetical protein